MSGYRMASEDLAVLTGVYKVVGAAVATKDPENVRGAVDAQLRSLYETTGADRLTLKVNGKAVGRLSVKVTKPSSVERFVVSDAEEFRGWVECVSDSDAREFVRRHAEEFAREHMAETGEIPDGCDVVTMEDEGGQWAGTTLTGCTPEKVADALGVPSLDAVSVVGLLGGGE